MQKSDVEQSDISPCKRSRVVELLVPHANGWSSPVPDLYSRIIDDPSLRMRLHSATERYISVGMGLALRRFLSRVRRESCGCGELADTSTDRNNSPPDGVHLYAYRTVLIQIESAGNRFTYWPLSRSKTDSWTKEFAGMVRLFPRFIRISVLSV